MAKRHFHNRKVWFRLMDRLCSGLSLCCLWPECLAARFLVLPLVTQPDVSNPGRELRSGALRWPMTFEVAKRAVGVMVLLLTVVLLLTPVPLSNVAPAMVISLISLAYVEQDGLLLSAAFLAAIILIGIGSAAVWGTIVSAVLISA